MTNNILVCTVGGSHEPIVKAIQAAKPDYVCFVCSGRDPATNKPGSTTQITGKGLVIKRHPSEDKPSLPNIPSQCNLNAEQFEIVEVPADDLDKAFRVIQEALTRLAGRFPNHRRLADYTGGTKTMTAALTIAALESEGVELQLVTGARSDLVKVQSGLETVVPASVERVRLIRAMAPHRAAWRRFAYGEAAQGLAALPAPHDQELYGELFMLRDLSRAFDAWDRFDHGAAARLLEAYRNRVGQVLAPSFRALRILVSDDPDFQARREALRLWDLWLNAQRRAAQGRYDDAVARLYRLIEWVAQWLLRTRCRIDTTNVDLDRIPPGMDLPLNRDGKRQATLYLAWELVGRLTTGPAAEFISTQREAMRHYINIRNNSILAHGFNPIHEADWKTMVGWLERSFIVMLQEEIAREEISLPPQLPVECEW